MKKLISLSTAIAGFFSLASIAFANLVVTPSNMMDWGFAQETGTTGVGMMVTGPDTPPLGAGSAQLSVGDTSSGVVLGKADYTGLAFADITDLSYSTYRQSGSSALAVALQFNADDDVTDADTSWKGRLVFEPYFTETILDNTWQTWNPMTQGKWWGTGAAISSSCSQASPCTWSELLTALPNVGVNSSFGGVLFKAGSGWDGFVGNVDAFSITVDGVTDTYDFEPDPTTPTDKSDCKDGGYLDFGYKNQGLCIASLVSNSNSAHN